MQGLKNSYEDQLKRLQENNDLLKQNIEKTQGLNVKHVENSVSLEQQLKYFQFISIASSFSKFTKDEFQELLPRSSMTCTRLWLVCLKR